MSEQDIREQDIRRLVRENERQKTALRALQSFAVNATFGGWRQRVWDLAQEGLNG